MFAILTLFIGSTVLLIVFFGIKHFELRRGIRFFEDVRGKFDTQIEDSEGYVVHVLPKKVAFHSVEIATNVAHTSTLFLLRGIRAVEHKLLGVSHAVKGKKEVHRRKASTSYLEDVTNHKKEIVRNRENGGVKLNEK